MSYMAPSDFIGRCLDAANTTLKDSLPGPLATSSFQVAGLTLHALPGPLCFEMNGYTFTVEMSDMHEMMQITAVMIEQQTRNCWEATMVLSKMNNSIIEHWLGAEPEDRADDLVLFKLMTNNRFTIYAAIQ